MPRALSGTVLARVGAAVLVLAAASGCSSDPSNEPEPTPTSTTPTSTTPTSTTRTSTTTPSAIPTSTTPPPAIPAGASWDLDFPDPFVLATDDGYLAFGTTSGLVRVQRLRSSALDGWDGPQEALVREPAWATPGSSWAPAVLEVADGWVLYYTVQVAGTDRHCISFALASGPAGPYRDDSREPFLCPDEAGGAIDPSPFTDVDGSTYLLWKNDGITLRRESRLWSQPLAPDGRSLTGRATPILDTTQSWEFPHVEAPSMTLADGTYWLAYSANWWNQPAYGVGLARCSSPSGPCTKPFDEPVLATAPGRYGPGGAEFFVDRSGRTLVAYHAWLDEPGYPGHRALHIGVPDLAADPPTLVPG
ncbi:MAG: family 43 glycosylhydrolase [Actinobacteria bacterium]|nr:family 43 glycosylhydrolase [Actinomycetota bacterium]